MTIACFNGNVNAAPASVDPIRGQNVDDSFAMALDRAAGLYNNTRMDRSQHSVAPLSFGQGSRQFVAPYPGRMGQPCVDSYRSAPQAPAMNAGMNYANVSTQPRINVAPTGQLDFYEEEHHFPRWNMRMELNRNQPPAPDNQMMFSKNQPPAPEQQAMLTESLPPAPEFMPTPFGRNSSIPEPHGEPMPTPFQQNHTTHQPVGERCRLRSSRTKIPHQRMRSLLRMSHLLRFSAW